MINIRRLVQNFKSILEWGQGTCSLMKHTRRWAFPSIFSLHAAYSALQHFYITNSLLANFFPFTIYVSHRKAALKKNAAKRSRQHVGEKYREYAQRRVCFINEQVPCPNSNIYVKLCTSRLCMKMLSFLFVFAWAMPRILYSSCGIQFPVWTPDNISGLTSVVMWLSS